MDCTYIWFFISQILSCELTGSFFNSVEITSLQPGEPHSTLSCDRAAPTALHKAHLLCAGGKLPTTQDLVQLQPNSDCPFLPLKRESKGKAWPQFPQECFQSADSGNERFELWTTRGINVSGETERLLEIFYLGQWRKTAHFNTLDMLPYIKVVVSGKKEIHSKLQVIESIQNVGSPSWEAGKVLNHLT